MAIKILKIQPTTEEAQKAFNAFTTGIKRHNGWLWYWADGSSVKFMTATADIDLLAGCQFDAIFGLEYLSPENAAKLQVRTLRRPLDKE